jgi:hypothetical protein
MLRSRVLGWFFLALTGGIGLACLVGAVTESDGRATLVGASVVCLGAAAVVWVGVLAPRDAARRTATVPAGGEQVLVVRLRSTTPWVMTITGGIGTVLIIWSIFGVGLTDGGLPFAPLLFLFAPVLAEGLWAFGRRAQLEIGAEAVHYRGWGLDARLAWDDVDRVEQRVEGKYSRIWVIARDGAPSWQAQRRKLVLPLDPAPKLPEFGVLTSALDDPGALYATLRLLKDQTLASRRAYMGPTGLACVRRKI